MTNLTETRCDLTILEQIEKYPDTTQATLASQLGVAVGTINWHIKRLIAKGYVKAKRAERRKLQYLITSEGLALRANLTMDYIQSSFSIYRLVRQRMFYALQKVDHKGRGQIRLLGDGDVAEVCRLTCLEQGVEIVDLPDAPCLIIKGLKVYIEGEDEFGEDLIPS